ncbi:hypothetical protein [Kribbella italica]|uniref:Uncharacterized protein n=1 Tax=Kribbella italica TaxID=1540520 RepID=A0A7W9J0S6_9ACTN|nr:hypothetical protein [Kribbella italica]MBB5833546.1 hypothetical protein [Kribbella italica]
MAIAGRRRVLDQWARALDVTNDLDAMHKLRRLMNDLDDARSQLQKTTKVLAAVPDPDANAGATGAMTALDQASAALLVIERRFNKHERGGR